MKGLLKGMLPMSRRAALLAALLPRRYWFRGVTWICSAQGVLARLGGHPAPGVYTAMAREGYFIELTQHGAFPILYRVIGAEDLRMTEADRGGLLYAGMHLPLMGVSVRALGELGVPPWFAIAAADSISADGRWRPTGYPKGMPAEPPGAGAMLRARTTLRARGVVGSLIDEGVRGPLSGSLMRLAGRMGARVILFWSELDAHGEVLLTYQTAPHPIPDTEEKVQANLALLERERERIFTALTAQRRLFAGRGSAHARAESDVFPKGG